MALFLSGGAVVLVLALQWVTMQEWPFVTPSTADAAQDHDAACSRRRRH